MADIFNNMKNSFNKSQAVSKINKSISDTNAKISSLKLELGEMMYNSRKNADAQYDFESVFQEIFKYENVLEDFKADLLAANGFKKCFGCGADIAVDSVFCAKCGAKQPEQPVVAAASASDAVFCVSCGAKINSDTLFCPSCGAKQDK